MATLTAHLALDMDELHLWNPWHKSFSPELIVAGSSWDRFELAGAFERTSVGGQVVYSGIATSFRITDYGTPKVELTGLALDIGRLQTLYAEGGQARALEFALQGNDTILGSPGADLLYGFGGKDLIRGGGGDDVIYGGGGDDRLEGGPGRDRLYGQAGNDRLFGGAGDDELFGGIGDDRLVGGNGKDRLTGGPGADVFVFRTAAEAGLGGRRDVITDFSHKQGDKIDLSAIDASTKAGGNQAFAFIGGKAFSGTPGELAYAKGILAGDVDGDRIADFEIRLEGAPALAAGDFLL